MNEFTTMPNLERNVVPLDHNMIRCWCRSKSRSAAVDVESPSCGCWYIRVKPVVSSAKLVPNSETCATISVSRSKCSQRAARCRPTALCACSATRRKWSNVSSTLWKCCELWVANSLNVTLDFCLVILHWSEGNYIKWLTWWNVSRVLVYIYD